jgi:glycosyltransferase involved in cell wall biosynthesis
MRVLYFIPRYDSAAMGNRIHSEVIEAWREHGVEAEVLALAAHLSETVSSREEGITVHRLPVSAGRPLKLANRLLTRLLPYPYLAGAFFHYRRFLASHSYDLVHIETAFPLGLVATAVAPAHSPPLAVTLPGADIMAEPAYDYGYARSRAVRALLPRVFRRAATLRADSPYLREIAIQRGADPHKVVAIPYNITVDSYPPAGVDLSAFRQQARSAIVARYNLDPARPIVVSLNRLHPFKGIAYLVDAIAPLRQRGIAAQVLVVGPNRSTPRFGDYGAHLAARAADGGVSDAVLQVGGVPHHEAITYLAAADAVVVPSVAESFSRVVIEAAAVGTPPVVTRTTGASAYVAQHNAGAVVEPRSGTAIAEGLFAVLHDGARWNEYSQRAYAMAPEFSSKQIAAQLLALYGGKQYSPEWGS